MFDKMMMDIPSSDESSSSSTSSEGQEDVILAALDNQDETLYRIMKADGRIVYVRIVSPDFLPPRNREHGAAAIDELQRIPMWDDEWETLEIRSLPRGVSYRVNEWKPHGVPCDDLLPYVSRTDQSDLPVTRVLGSRTYEVEFDGEPAIMKVANFEFQMPAFTKELGIYHAMGHSVLKPNLLTYVVESHDPERVVGFVIDKIRGRWAGPEDFEVCNRYLQYMHTLLFHGDLNKHTIIMSHGSPKFISFKNSEMATDENYGKRERERRSLARVLGVAKPRRAQSPE